MKDDMKGDMKEGRQHLATTVFPCKPEIAAHAKINAATYAQMYAKSLHEPEVFWAEMAERLQWYRFPQRVMHWQFAPTAQIRWYDDGLLNVSANCIDRHLPHKAEDVAILWESDDGERVRRITYAELHAEVQRMANVLKRLGVVKGDRVTIYLPMIPEAAYAMLACARIGAVHSVVFGGFSPEALRSRIEDCASKVVITADQGMRGGKAVPLKENVDQALGALSDQTVLVIQHTGAEVGWQEGRDQWWHVLREQVSAECAPEVLEAEHPLFILYTSGSTGKPKGVLHTSGGYLTYASLTHELVFDYRPGDIYWCTADVGWITGHSYVVYGPLANGATTLMFEGVPNAPSPDRWWNMVDRHRVSIFYTAPTAVRSLLREGEQWLQGTSRESLRILGSVGEPINPEAWRWLYHQVGHDRCPIVDSWWQTETGGIMIVPLPGACDMKPGAAMRPFFGVEPVLLDMQGQELPGEAEGALCLKRSWPGQARSVYGDHARFHETYFSQYSGYYFTGDGARRDADGDIWIVGRMDDVLNISGHRMGTAELEAALNEHPDVTESAVVGIPHPIKGEGMYVYATLLPDVQGTPEKAKELKQWLRQQIGAIATPDVVHFASGLPRTRSGKIMRRILRKLAHGEVDQLGDISTLVNPDIIGELVRTRPEVPTA